MGKEQILSAEAVIKKVPILRGREKSCPLSV
jgi:hypothetical protein